MQTPSRGVSVFNNLDGRCPFFELASPVVYTDQFPDVAPTALTTPIKTNLLKISIDYFTRSSGPGNMNKSGVLWCLQKTQ